MTFTFGHGWARREPDLRSSNINVLRLSIFVLVQKMTAYCMYVFMWYFLTMLSSFQNEKQTASIAALN